MCSSDLLVVRNQGHGKMPGRVTSDKDWIFIPQPRLDPVAAEQAVVITIATDTLPRGASSGVVTVVTDHGQRHVVTVQVQRQSFLPIIGGIVAIGFLGIFALVLFYVLAQWSAPTPTPGPAPSIPEAPAGSAPAEIGRAHV